MTTTYSLPTRSGRRSLIVPLLQGLLDGLWRRRMRRHTYSSLAALDDRALKDIGLDRSEIGSVVDRLV